MTGPMRVAKLLAFKSRSKFRLGACLAKKGRVVSVGYNQMDKTHPRQQSKYPFLHAETHSLIGLRYEETVGCDLYVVRIDREGKLKNAKPCASCMNVIEAAGIRRIYYTDEDGIKQGKV